LSHARLASRGLQVDNPQRRGAGDLVFLTPEGADAVKDTTLTLLSSDEFECDRSPSGPTHVGRYQIRGVLGTGAMGVVYHAYDPDLGRAVAIKVVRDTPASTSSQARLLREAQAMARLRHPNVVPIFDVGQVDGAVFVAMPLLEGGTLKRWLRDGSPPLDAILDRFIAAGRGLAAAHAAGLVHRDFKPDNVLLGTDGEIHVADFGLARFADDGGAPNASAGPLAPGVVTQTGTVLGTPAYMAPEQLRNQPIDARADQFSFCVALWEAIYGTRPFPDPPSDIARLLRARFDAIAAGPPQPRRDHTSSIARLLVRGLAADPDDRWPTMQDLLDAIAHRRSSRLRSRWLAVGLGILVVVAAIFVFGSTGHEVLHDRPAAQDRDHHASHAAAPPGGASVARAGVQQRSEVSSSVPPDTCPRGMVYVPSGKAMIGSPDDVGDPDEHPMHEVELAAYCIDGTEVTVGEYMECVTSGHCSGPALTVSSPDYLASDVKRYSEYCNGNERPEYPMNCVDWYQATTYCTWVDRRLPTEAEWEYAARGPERRTYPWGSEPPNPTLLNSNGDADGFKMTSPVGSYPAGVSPFGALDMAGNVWEWTSDLYGPYPNARVTTLRGATGTTRSLRGGGWMNINPDVARAAFRNWGDPYDRIPTLGFRCARND
jgi:formylglycine-generating enzyme required for sulfatase activity